jgi:hypothetical protein
MIGVVFYQQDPHGYLLLRLPIADGSAGLTTGFRFDNRNSDANVLRVWRFEALVVLFWKQRLSRNQQEVKHESAAGKEGRDFPGLA